jgi:hypothetical protein
MPDDFGVTVVTNSYAFLFCMRGYGRIERPVFPAPSEFQMASHDPNLARITRRDRGGVGVFTSPRLRGEVEAVGFG